jgi:hypothetical protein
MERETLLGSCIVAPATRQVISFLKTGHTEVIHGINAPAGGERIVLYTPEFEPHSPGDPTGVEILVEMNRPAMIIPLPRMATGTIRAIHAPADEEMPIPFDHVVIAGYGLMGGVLYDNSMVGEQIGISLELQDMGSDCHSPEIEDWTKTYAGLDVGVAFLQDGEIVHDPAPHSISRHPRTAVAFSDDFLYFVVVDGRNSEYSVGMTLDELGEFVRGLGAGEVNLDEDPPRCGSMAWWKAVLPTGQATGPRQADDGGGRAVRLKRSGGAVVAAARFGSAGPGFNYTPACIPASTEDHRHDAGSLGRS